MAMAQAKASDAPHAAHSGPTEEGGRRPGPMAMCPMAETCKGMMERPSRGWFLFLPALLFIAVGVLIVFEPQVLVWLMAAASILFGLMLLVLANFMRSVGARLRGPGS